jgi:hypothetical protein
MTGRDGSESKARKRAGRRARWVARRRRRPESRRPERRAEGSRREGFPYRGRRALLSKGELAFYRALTVAIADNWVISVKIRLADVIWCPPAEWKTAHGARVSQKHLDFVLYDRETTEVVLAVELDDRSHARSERRARDAFVDEVLERCGVLLLRVRAAAVYDVAALQTRLEALAGCQRLPRREEGS